MRQNLPWSIAVDSSMFPASGTACGSYWESVLWVGCCQGWCKTVQTSCHAWVAVG